MCKISGAINLPPKILSRHSVSSSHHRNFHPSPSISAPSFLFPSLLSNFTSSQDLNSISLSILAKNLSFHLSFHLSSHPSIGNQDQELHLQVPLKIIQPLHHISIKKHHWSTSLTSNWDYFFNIVLSFLIFALIEHFLIVCNGY